MKYSIMLFPALMFALSVEAVAATAVYVVPAETRVNKLDERIVTGDFLWSPQENVIRLAGAGREVLRFQVTVAVDRDTLRQVRLDWTALESSASAIQASAIRAYLAALVKVYAASGEAGSTGWFQDPLAPLTDPLDILPDRWESRKNQTFWLEVRIPAGQKPGIYEGKLSVRAASGVLAAIPLRLEVYPFDLPESLTQYAMFNCNKGWMSHYYDDERLDGRTLDEVLAQYFDFMLERGIQPWFNPLLQPDYRDNGMEYELSWPNPGQEKRYLNHPAYRRVTFSAAPRELEHLPEHEKFTPEFNRKVKSWVRGIYEHYQANGWLEKLSFFGPVDEPNTRAEYEELIRWGQLVREAAPKAGFQVTEQPLPQQPDWPSLSQVATDWVVHGTYLESNKREIGRLIGDGHQASWYISCDQLYPMANYFIDMTAADSRIVSWITRRYGMKGILYWAVNFWPEVRSPWRDTITWKRSSCNAPLAGEGSLLYPGEEVRSYCGQQNVRGPVSSVRFEMLAKGMQDVEYLYLLEKLGFRAEADRLSMEMVLSAEIFSREPGRFEQVKAEAAALIARAIAKSRN